MSSQDTTEKRTARLLVAEDHDVVLDALVRLLQPEYSVVAGVKDGLELLAAARRLKPDVVVLDVRLPGLTGIEAAKRLSSSLPKVKIVFFTMHGESATLQEAILAGASGYVLKTSPVSELEEAIRKVLRGETHLPEPAKQPRDSSVTEPLSPRQLEILGGIAAGHSAKQIADDLCLSPRTIEYHKYRLMQRFGVQTVAELVSYAIKSGLVP